MKVLLEQAMNEGTTNMEIAQKKVEGRMKKFYSDNCLINQVYCLEDSNDYTIKKMIDEYQKNYDIQIELTKMAVFNLGEIQSE